MLAVERDGIDPPATGPADAVAAVSGPVPAPAEAGAPSPGFGTHPRRRRRRPAAATPSPVQGPSALPAAVAGGHPAAGTATMDQSLMQLARELGVDVNEDRWFRQALYHTSYVNERGLGGISSNERLEFLGDAVLDLAVAQYLFERFPQMPEGDLSRLRSAVVRASTLAARSRALGLGRFALLGKGEERSGGRRRPNFLADLYEAVVGAIFLDQGIGAATEFVLRSLQPDLDAAADGFEHANYKARLQDAVQRSTSGPISYHVVSVEGPEHARIWQSEVHVAGRRAGSGHGRTKRAAEQEAAREALLRGWGHAEV